MSGDDVQVFGVGLPDLPEGWQPVEVLAIVKCLLPEGEHAGSYALATRYSEGLAPWDVAGMLHSSTLNNNMDLVEGAERGDEI